MTYPWQFPESFSPHLEKIGHTQKVAFPRVAAIQWPWVKQLTTLTLDNKFFFLFLKFNVLSKSSTPVKNAFTFDQLSQLK